MLESGDLAPGRSSGSSTSARRRQRPDAAGVLMALGIAVAYAGAAIAYGVAFSGLSRTAQELTPFLFPAVAIGAAVMLARAGRPRWQAEAAGLIGQIALAAAFLTLAGVLDPDTRPASARCAASPRRSRCWSATA